jgi:hypothetical protein
MLDWIIDAIGLIIRAFVYRLFETLLEKIFYWPGWLLLRLITYGRYPPRGAVKHNRFAVGLFAFTLTASAPLLYALIAK